MSAAKDAAAKAGFSRKSDASRVGGDQRAQLFLKPRMFVFDLCEKRRPIRPGSLECRVEQGLEPGPVVRVHRGHESDYSAAPGACALSWACSHALAMLHSRLIVAGEMCSTSAVSSTLKPPKNLSSTTRA